jgi:tetratricopeptide (TPR) repeat protein
MADMAEEHPSREILERFLLAQLPASETRRVLRHLLAGCSRCQEAASRLWELSSEVEAQTLPRAASSLDAAYDEVLDRVFKRVEAKEVALERERAQASVVCGELLRHPPMRQHLLVNNSARFRSRAICEHLLEQSQEAGFQVPARALELAEVAVDVGERLEPLEEEEAVREALSNLRARAWAQLANARRINSDHAGADLAFERAESLLSDPDGVGLLDKARIFDLKASLRRDQRRLPEAFELMDAVIAIYRNLGQTRLLGRALAQKAVVVMEANDGEAAISLLHRALELLDPNDDPRMFLAARHNLIYCLNASGRPREAFALLFHSRPYYLQAGDRMNLLRLRWVEGQVAAGLGRSEQAEVAFREVRGAFMELGLVYDAALATLDLAGLYAEQGRTADVQRLTEEILGVFRERGVHREAIAAVLVLHEAAQQEQARLALVREVTGFLRRARNNPDLRFTPGS